MPDEDKRAIIANAWRTIIDALGYDTSSPHFKDSPARVADFLTRWHTHGKELKAGEHAARLTTFPNDDNEEVGLLKYDGVVMMRDIGFHSMCAHHGLPFFGRAHVAYLPKDKLIGLSKLARVVEHFAHQFQVQEQLTTCIANHLNTALEPLGIAVVLEAEHLCASMRGVGKPGHSTITSALLGGFRDQAARLELLLLKGNK